MYPFRCNAFSGSCCSALNCCCVPTHDIFLCSLCPVVADPVSCHVTNALLWLSTLYSAAEPIAVRQISRPLPRVQRWVWPHKTTCRTGLCLTCEPARTFILHKSLSAGELCTKLVHFDLAMCSQIHQSAEAYNFLAGYRVDADAFHRASSLSYTHIWKIFWLVLEEEMLGIPTWPNSKHVYQTFLDYNA